MKRNIDNRGRAIRAVLSVLIFAGAAFAWPFSRLLAGILVVSAAFVLFEALRGWCALRACGIKTKF